jgi:hypothetical protein
MLEPAAGWHAGVCLIRLESNPPFVAQRKVRIGDFSSGER